MSEVLHNKTRTTCSGSYTAGSGTLNVASGSGITPTCSVAILDQSDLTSIKALLTVSAKATNALTVASEGIDTNAVNGDVVAVVNTKRSLANYIGLVLLEQHTASSSASLDFTTWYNSDYDEYLVEFLNLVPATDAVQLLLRVSTDGGSNYDSGSNYSYSNIWWNNGGTSQSFVNGQTSIHLTATGQSNDANFFGFSGFLRLINPAEATRYKAMLGEFFGYGASVAREVVKTAGGYEVSTAYNAFKLSFSSGNIGSGVVRVYGIRK